jgi:hypothetical protein
MSHNTVPKPEQVKVKLNLGVVSVASEWIPNEAEKKASWELYIELVTRISIYELPKDEGLLRESLSSLYTIFGRTREILREHGIDVARVDGKDRMSFAFLAIIILNYVLRPFLTRWHTKLSDWEATNTESISTVEHERNWSEGENMRLELNKIRIYLIEYANLLAEVAGVPSLIVEAKKLTRNDESSTQLSDQVFPFYVDNNKI